MNPSERSAVVGILVDDQMQFTLAELSRICKIDIALVVELVDEMAPVRSVMAAVGTVGLEFWTVTAWVAFAAVLP